MSFLTCGNCNRDGCPNCAMRAQLAAVTAERDEAMQGFNRAVHRATVYWAECEAWRKKDDEVSEPDQLQRIVEKAREASDRARGEANPTPAPLGLACSTCNKFMVKSGNVHTCPDCGLSLTTSNESPESITIDTLTPATNPTYTPPTEGGENPQ